MSLTSDSPEPNTSGARISRNSIVTISLVVIAVCIGGAALMYLRDILTPLLIAIFLYFLIQPVIEYLFRMKLPPWLLYPVMVALPLLVALLMFWVIDFNVRAFALRLGSYQESLIKILNSIGPYVGMHPDEITDAAKNVVAGNVDKPADPSSLAENLKKVTSPATKYDWQGYIGEYFKRSQEQLIAAVFGATMHFIEVTVLVVFYLLFLFLEARKLRSRVHAGFEKETAGRIVSVMDKIDESIRQYLWIKTAVSLGLGVTTAVIGLLFGLDFAVLWGIFAFLANYITYVGSIAALVPPIAIAFLQLSPTAAIILTVLLVLNRLVWIDYAEIRFSGEHLDVSPLLLLLSIALLGWIWGVVGMLLAVPLVTSTKIVLSHFENTRHWAKLMSDD